MCCKSAFDLATYVWMYVAIPFTYKECLRDVIFVVSVVYTCYPQYFILEWLLTKLWLALIREQHTCDQLRMFA